MQESEPGMKWKLWGGNYKGEHYEPQHVELFKENFPLYGHAENLKLLVYGVSQEAVRQNYVHYVTMIMNRSSSDPVVVSYSALPSCLATGVYCGPEAISSNHKPCCPFNTSAQADLRPLSGSGESSSSSSSGESDAEQDDKPAPVTQKVS